MVSISEIADGAALRLWSRILSILGGIIVSVIGVYLYWAFERVQSIPSLEQRILATETASAQVTEIGNRIGKVEVKIDDVAQNVDRINSKLDQLFVPRHAEEENRWPQIEGRQ